MKLLQYEKALEIKKRRNEHAYVWSLSRPA